jgi:hypothetical protein
MARPDTPLITLALRAAIAVPLLYFGVQLVAAPFYPDYSFLAHDASTLGSSGSTRPAIFNGGALASGVALAAAAWGFLRALRRASVAPALAWDVALALLCGAVSTINAGLHPLPDPRHTAGVLAAAGIGLFVLPFLLPFAMRGVPSGRGLRIYLAANLAVVIALAPVVSGLLQRIAMRIAVTIAGLQDFLNHDQGLLQRIAAATVFLPVGVCAMALLRAYRVERESKPIDAVTSAL